MMKKLLVSSVVVGMLCAPAMADPSPPAAPSSMTMKLAISDGADTRTYELVVLPDSCGSVEDVAGDRRDEVKLCAHAAAQGARLSTQWKLRSKNVEHAINFEAVVAKGKKIEVGRDKGPRFTLTWI